MVKPKLLDQVREAIGARLICPFLHYDFFQLFQWLMFWRLNVLSASISHIKEVVRQYQLSKRALITRG